MKIIRPIDINSFLETSDDKLTTTNVTITETAWTAGTYSTGTRRYVGTQLYEVVASPSTSDDPTAGAAANPATWILVGNINPYAMFDTRIATQSENSGTIAVRITPAEIVNSVALFNVVGNTLNITVTDPVDGEVYNSDFVLQDNSPINNWYSYFFETIVDKPDFAALDLPNYINAYIDITLDAGAGTAKIGELVLGKQQLLGRTKHGTTVSIKDYSTKQRDIFGNATILERAFSKRVDFDVAIATDQAGGVNKVLSDIRTTPIVYVGDAEREETVVYGYYRDFSITLQPTISELTIDVEGLV